MGREITGVKVLLKARINDLRRLEYLIRSKPEMLTEESCNLLIDFFENVLTHDSLYFIEEMIKDNTPIKEMKQQQLRRVAKLLGIVDPFRKTKEELLVLIEKKGGEYVKTYAQTHGVTEGLIGRSIAGNFRNGEDKVSKET